MNRINFAKLCQDMGHQSAIHNRKVGTVTEEMESFANAFTEAGYEHMAKVMHKIIDFASDLNIDSFITPLERPIRKVFLSDSTCMFGPKPQGGEHSFVDVLPPSVER